jgi:hypothetical protein
VTLPSQDHDSAADLAATMAVARIIARGFPPPEGADWREHAYRLHVALSNLMKRLDSAPTSLNPDGSFTFPAKDMWIMQAALHDASRITQAEGNGFALATYRAMLARTEGRA